MATARRPDRHLPPIIGRRTFLADLGRAGLGVLVLGVGVSACGDGDDATSTTGTGATGSAPPAGDTGTSSTTPTTEPDGTATEDTATTSDGEGALAWERVSLGFVSAYVLVRGGEAAVVDTGVEGSEDAIADGLAAAGVGWSDVGHVVLTHHHPDHVGSAPAVLDLATGATAYAGAEDIPQIGGDLPLRPVADGDDVFGLRVVATPGHTPGHVSVHDPSTGLLVAGDALTSADGQVTGPDPEFTPDMATALDSVARLAGLDLRTILVGHGDPVTGGDLAARLQTIAAG